MFQEIKEIAKKNHVGKGFKIKMEEKELMVLEYLAQKTDTVTYTNCPEAVTHLKKQGIPIDGCVYRCEIRANGVTDRIGYFIRMKQGLKIVEFTLLVQDEGVVHERQAKIYNEDRSQLVQVDRLRQIEQALIDYVQELPEFRLHFATGNVR